MIEIKTWYELWNTFHYLWGCHKHALVDKTCAYEQGVHKQHWQAMMRFLERQDIVGSREPVKFQHQVVDHTVLLKMIFKAMCESPLVITEGALWELRFLVWELKSFVEQRILEGWPDGRASEIIREIEKHQALEVLWEDHPPVLGEGTIPGLCLTCGMRHHEREVGPEGHCVVCGRTHATPPQMPEPYEVIDLPILTS